MKTVRLGDIAKIDRDSVSPNAIVDGTTYVGLENIAPGGQFHGVGPVANGDLASSKFLFSKHHILYGKLRPYLAKIAVPSFSGVCSTDILPIRVGASCDKMYVTHFLRQQSVIDKVNGLATGANLPRVNPKVLESVELPLPPLDEQRRIAAILDKADELRSKRRQVLGHLDALPQSIFHEMFGDPVSARHKAPLSQILTAIESGQSPVCDDRPALLSEWGVLKLSAVTKQEFDDTEHKALVKGEPDPRHEVHPGDVLFSRKNTPALVAAVALVRSTRPKLLLPDLIFRLRIADRGAVTPDYLQAVLAHPRQRSAIQRLAGGSASSMSNISKAKLMTVQIPIPPLELQQSFATRVAAVERLKETQRKHLAQLDTLFASLQHRAFTGEL